MPRVSVERLRAEVADLLRRVDVHAMSQRQARNELERALMLEEGDLFDDKELINQLLRDAMVQQEAARLIEVQVQSELGDGKQSLWSQQLTVLADQELRPLVAEQWLKAHPGIPEIALGFDMFANDSWMPFDTDNPEAVGWDPSTPLRLLAYPKDERFIYRSPEVAKATPSPSPSQEESPEPERHRKSATKRKAPELLADQKPKKAPKKKAARVGVKKDAKPKAKPRARESGAKTLADVGEDEPLVFRQANPRKPNKDPWFRYEKYKVASTLREARDLGACRGDLLWDFQKGFFTLLK